MSSREQLARYRLATVDLAARNAGIFLDPDEAGVAVTFRYRGAVVGFVIEPVSTLPASRYFDPCHLVDGAMADRAIARAIRDELGMPANAEILSLTIAICTRDRPEFVERCLASLETMDRSSAIGCMLQIIVIDNAPPDGRTRAVVLRHPNVEYVVESRQGLNFARNRALLEGRGELVAFLDDDVVVDTGWLQGLLAAWGEDPSAGLFVGQVLPMELDSPAQVLFERRGGFRRGFVRTRYRAERPQDPLYPCTASLIGTGANMAVRREAALLIGGFDVALDTGASLPGGGDLDIFYRMIRGGYRAVYDPDYLVLHLHRRDMEGLRRQYRNSWGIAFAAFVVKCWRTDAPMRRKWSRLAGRWFAKQLVHFGLSVIGRHVRPARLIVAEATGGVIGLCGGYDRSRRRIDQIARRAE